MCSPIVFGSLVLPYVAFLSLHRINACLPQMALLKHSNPTLVSSSHPSTYCTWREIRRLLLRNIVRIPLSLHSYHATLLLRLRLVVGTILSVHLLLTSDFVYTDLDQSCGLFLVINIISFSLIFLQRLWRFITFQLHPLYVLWYSSNQTNNG